MFQMFSLPPWYSSWFYDFPQTSGLASVNCPLGVNVYVGVHDAVLRLVYSCLSSFVPRRSNFLYSLALAVL